MIQILTNNGIDNTNIDYARAENFNAGNKSGVVKGALTEGSFFAPASNIIALSSCELRMCGHRIVIDETITITLSNTPTQNERFSMIAQIIVKNKIVTFSILLQNSLTALIQDNLYGASNGNGKYQLEIGRFTQTNENSIVEVLRTVLTISGCGETGATFIPNVEHDGTLVWTNDKDLQNPPPNDVFKNIKLISDNALVKSKNAEANSVLANEMSRQAASNGKHTDLIAKEAMRVAQAIGEMRNPVTGLISNMQMVIYDIFNCFSKGITAAEYDELQLNANVYDGKVIAALDFDKDSKLILKGEK